MEIEITREYIRYPKEDQTELSTLNMSDVCVALESIDKVAHVTRGSAPGLMSLFNSAYKQLGEKAVYIRYQVSRTENEINKRRAEILLDPANSKLGNAAMREARIVTDSAYQTLLNHKDMLDAILKYLELQIKSVDMAYMATKKCYDSLYQP
jgi:hypothetical protein